MAVTISKFIFGFETEENKTKEMNYSSMNLNVIFVIEN